MKTGWVRLFALATFLIFSQLVNGQNYSIIINEFMPLNETFRADEDGDYSDWIEIYNSGSSPVSLSGWSLTDDPEIIDKWIFPGITLNAGAYLLIYSSGKNRAVAGQELHTGFRLDGDGEYLGLFDPQGNPITVFDPFPPVKVNQSFGYLEGELTMFATPTPGKANDEFGAVLSDPEFSVVHGLFYESFTVSIQSASSSAVIYYTTDGSLPGHSNGRIYSTPLHIDTTTILRAIATKGFQFPSEVKTVSYIFPEQVIRQGNAPTNFPDQWGPWTQSDGRAYADYEMDPEVLGISGENKLLAAMESLPTLSLVSNPDHFWSMDTDPETGGIYMYPAPGENDIGRGWERPVSVEYFIPDGSEGFQVNCGIQINGGESRRPEKNPKHSFRLRFRGDYGPSKLNYPLFEEPSVSKFDALVLRGGFNNSWTHWGQDQRVKAQYIHDIWAKDTYRKMNHVAGNSTFVHLFINGVYWGIYAPSERMDAEFAASYLKGDAQDFDVIKDYVEVADGEIDAWNDLLAAVNAGLSSDEAYFAVQGMKPDGTPDPEGRALLDVSSLIDYMLINFYGGNTDWDHHNWAATRNRNNPEKGFELLIWDTEHIMESLTQNMLGEFNSGCPSNLFQRARENEQFRRTFADHVQKYCFEDGLLAPAGVQATWEKRKVGIEPAIPAESARWGDYRRDVHVYSSGPYELYTYENHWLAEKDWLYNTYFPERSDALIQQFRAGGLYPALDAPQFKVNGAAYTQAVIEAGDQLSITATAGSVYYTLNGTDPATWESNGSSGERNLLSMEAGKKVIVPHSDLGTDWLSDPDFDDSAWQDCSGSPGGVGYEKGSGYENMISLDVSSDMYDGGTDPNTSCYIRIPFSLSGEQLADLGVLKMGVLFDDGFTAWLNGTKIASVNAPESLVWNSASSAQHEAGESPESINISEFIPLLGEGENLLAIHGLNAKTSSSDFIINVSITGMEAAVAGISEDAQLYTGVLDLDSSLLLSARTFLEGEWSAMNRRYFLIPEQYLDLKITEVQYNPESVDSIDDDNFEFIEIKNTGSGTLDMEGVRLADGIRYEFDHDIFMDPHSFIVLASDDFCFESKYGFKPFDEYKGRLDNGGERISLLDPFSDTICSFRYDDDLPWPQYADGTGLSMVPVELNPKGDLRTPEQWRESYYRGGSPGEDDVDTISHVVVPGEFSWLSMGEIYPNPFTETAYLEYSLDEASDVQIAIYSISGSLVQILSGDRKQPGNYRVFWNGNDTGGREVPSGIYLCRIVIRSERNEFAETRKVVYLK